MNTFDVAHEKVNFPKNQNHIKLFVQEHIDTRSEVLLSHPEVLGFVYIHQDVITKTFFPRKVVNFKVKCSSKRKSITSVSGSSEEYSQFSVQEKILLSNHLHPSDSKRFLDEAPKLNIWK